MSIKAELHRLIDEMLSSDPRRALPAYRRLTVEHLPWLERRAVLLARRERWTWAAIGRLLGRSRQAVQRKFDRVFSVSELTPSPPPPLDAADEITDYYDRLLAQLAANRFVDEAGDDGSLVPW